MFVEGARIDTTPTRSNERRLKITGRAKTHPQGWVTWITPLPSNVLWDWRQGPGTSSERAHLRERLPRPNPNEKAAIDLSWTKIWATPR